MGEKEMKWNGAGNNCRMCQALWVVGVGESALTVRAASSGVDGKWEAYLQFRKIIRFGFDSSANTKPSWGCGSAGVNFP